MKSVRQGCPISLFFAIYIADLKNNEKKRHWKSQSGSGMFLDVGIRDLILLAKNEEAMKESMSRLKRHGIKDKDLIVNCGK